MLENPEKQWRSGYSARTLAHAWEAAHGHFPHEIKQMLADSENERFGNLEMLLAFPEWKVYLPPRGHASQNDLFILAKGDQGLVTIMVEGKVEEPFGKMLAGWLKQPTPGKLQRLAFIQSKLGLKGSLPRTIRYQLLHRVTCAVMEAERFGARSAMMLVHSFSQECMWFDDYQAFMSLFGRTSVTPGKLYQIAEVNGGIFLFCGWAIGNNKFLDA